VFFHWKGLGASADRLVINQFNKQDGWHAFLKWIESQPDTLSMLSSLANRAGVPEEAAAALKKLGVKVDDVGSQRVLAFWIRDVVKDGKKEDLEKAQTLLLQDPDLLEGVLPMLEDLNVPEVAIFLNSLIKTGISNDADHLVRKSLYHLKQKGIALPEEPAKPQQAKDYLFLGENRIPLWQPVLYFRYGSSFSDTFDLYTIRIFEGRDITSLNQQRGFRVERAKLQKLVRGYSQQLQNEIGILIPFRSVSHEQGRYFLKKTMSLAQEEKNAAGVRDLLQLIGNEPVENPWVDFSGNSNSDLSSTNANLTQLLESEYFQAWTFLAEDFQEYIAALDKLREGPIILTEHQIHEMSHASTAEALKKYMESPARDAWAFAFEKAAFFLRDSDVERATVAWNLSKLLEDRSVPPEQIPAVTILLNRMLALLEQQKQARLEEEKKSSVIMSPQEFARRNPQR
jgi:urease gamma subunit